MWHRYDRLSAQKNNWLNKYRIGYNRSHIGPVWLGAQLYLAKILATDDILPIKATHLPSLSLHISCQNFGQPWVKKSLANFLAANGWHKLVGHEMAPIKHAHSNWMCKNLKLKINQTKNNYFLVPTKMSQLYLHTSKRARATHDLYYLTNIIKI
jgi:hypothetical protein